MKVAAIPIGRPSRLSLSVSLMVFGHMALLLEFFGVRNDMEVMERSVKQRGPPREIDPAR